MQANIGQLDDRDTRYKFLLGNMALLQVQATLVSFISACLSFILGLIMSPSPVPVTSTSPASSTLVSARMLTLLHHPRRPRPSAPIDVGRSKSGIAELGYSHFGRVH